MGIDHERFRRILDRCTELATAQGPTSIIGLVYAARAEAPFKAYLEADSKLTATRSAHAKENREAQEALSKLDGPYRVARSATAAILPDLVLPDTLKTRPTDTDKENAIEELLDRVDDHIGTPWADAILASEFGQQAPKVLKELQESVAANAALGKATTDRAAAYGPAHEAYQAFKRVVRDALGPGSKEYRRIHLRASPGKAADEIEGSEPTTGAKDGAPPAGSPPANPTQGNPDNVAPASGGQAPA